MKFNQIRPSSLDSFSIELQSDNHLKVPFSTTACATSMAHNPENKGGYKNAKPFALNPLLPPQTPAGE